MINDFSNQHSLVNQYLKELRDVTIQKDRLRFNRNIERLGEIFAYEISKVMPFKATETQTPLGTANTQEIAEQPVIATILRAGLPLQQGMLRYFDHADSAYISAYRDYYEDGTFNNVVVEYIATPSLEDRIFILADPMLATGNSIVLAYKEFIKKGKPKQIHIVSVIGSRQGVEYVKEHIPEATIWIAGIDEVLNEHSYIIPGLGDAGDLLFGEKL